MLAINELLELSKTVAGQAGVRLSGFSTDQLTYTYSRDHAKEIKALADTILEEDILLALAPVGLPILSEESGYISSRQPSSYRFIVDPLDGTFNFVKGLGPSAVSIALWEEDKPIFGVIYSVLERQLVWGGASMGSYIDGRPIAVSATSDPSKGSICTGFPVRLDTKEDGALQRFWDTTNGYAKVRMLGSAAMSLLHVAKGSADAYSEDKIMLWDVAAGLAIVEGAGGRSVMQQVGEEWCYSVFASNPALLPTRLS